MKDEHEPLDVGGGSSNLIGDDQGLDYLGNEFTGD